MTEKVDPDVQSVVDAVVVGSAERLARALGYLAKTSPATFLAVTGKLLSTDQPTHISSVMAITGCASELYHAAGKVFGAAYVDEGFLCKQAAPVGEGIPYEDVKAVVTKVRAEYDETALKKARDLKGVLEELDSLLRGHSFADPKLASLAHVDLFRGHALLLAALIPER